MVRISMSVHPAGLSPIEAAKAWYLRDEQHWKWGDIQTALKKPTGEMPGLKAVRNGVLRARGSEDGCLPETRYANCGRHRALTPEEERGIVAFVKQWRTKRFCTCNYIVREMKLHVTPRTVANVLNRSGYFWKRVPKVTPLESKHIEARKAFVQKYGQKSVAWWRSHMSLIIDGVTLTKAPKGLSARQKHAAQSVGHMWMRQGERMSNDVHTFNRYGVQLGVKVPLWGGFTGNGVFALRLWTPTPKMSKPLWAARVPALRKAISEAGMPRPGESTSAFKVWQDNEGFLKQPDVYKQHGMRLVNFPPNSGDLSPIETVWARLRKDLAKREMVDLDNGVELSVLQFKQRAAQILASYSELGPNDTCSYLDKLVAGMPRRLQKCKDNGYGRCGK